MLSKVCGACNDSRGGPRKFRKRRPNPPPPPPSPPASNENFTFQDGAYSIVGLFMMQSDVKLTFRKI